MRCLTALSLFPCRYSDVAAFLKSAPRPLELHFGCLSPGDALRTPERSNAAHKLEPCTCELGEGKRLGLTLGKTSKRHVYVKRLTDVAAGLLAAEQSRKVFRGDVLISVAGIDVAELVAKATTPSERASVLQSEIEAKCTTAKTALKFRNMGRKRTDVQ